ncbi:MAG: hypothetical protein D6698_11520, partial [Gammaproteobacteria bacterium]
NDALYVGADGRLHMGSPTGPTVSGQIDALQLPNGPAEAGADVTIPRLDGGNLLPNGSFSVGLENWTGFGAFLNSTNVTAMSSGGYDGGPYAEVVLNAGTANNGWGALQQSNALPVSEGDVLVISGAIKGPSGAKSTGYIRIWFRDAANNLISLRYGPGASGDGTWKDVRHVEVAPAGVARWYIDFLVINQSSASLPTSETWGFDAGRVYFLPKNADDVFESSTKKWAAESGADITGSHISAGFTDQGALATRNDVDIALSHIRDNGIAVDADLLRNDRLDVLDDGRIRYGGTTVLPGQVKFYSLPSRPRNWQNIVRKPSFDDGDLGDWRGGGSNTVSTVSVTGVPFSKAMEVYSPNGSWDAIEDYTTVPVEEGQKVYIEGWLDTSQSSVQASILVAVRDENFAAFSWLGAPLAAGNGWTKVSATVTLPAGARYIQPVIGWHANAGDRVLVGPMYIGVMERGADITSSHTAAAIVGQGSGATANTLAELNATEGAKLAGIQDGADRTYKVSGEISLTTADNGTWVRVLKWSGFNGRGGIYATLSNSGGTWAAFSIDLFASVDWGGNPTLTIRHSSAPFGSGQAAIRVVADINAGATYLEMKIPNLTGYAILHVEARDIPASGINMNSLVIDEVHNTSVPTGAMVAEEDDLSSPVSAVSNIGNAALLRDGRVRINNIHPFGTDGLLASGLHPFDRLTGRTADKLTYIAGQ